MSRGQSTEHVHILTMGGIYPYRGGGWQGVLGWGEPLWWMVVQVAINTVSHTFFLFCTDSDFLNFVQICTLRFVKFFTKFFADPS